MAEARWEPYAEMLVYITDWKKRPKPSEFNPFSERRNIADSSSVVVLPPELFLAAMTKGPDGQQ